MLDLTFLYISFAKIFCQNFVKKNCKFVFRVSLKCDGIRYEKRGGRNLYDWPEVYAAIAGGVCQLREGELIVAAISVYYYPNFVRFGFYITLFFSVDFPVFSGGLRIKAIPAWSIPAVVGLSKDAGFGFPITQERTYSFFHIIYIRCRFHLYIKPFLFIY